MSVQPRHIATFVVLMLASAAGGLGLSWHFANRPNATATAQPRVVDTGAEAATDTLTTAAIDKIEAPNNPPAAATLRNGLEALREDRFDEARAIRDSLEADSLDNHILTWALVYFGGSRMPSGDIAATATKLQDWPGRTRFREHSERALYREAPSADTVLAAFGATTPETWHGAVVLARAYLTKGDRNAAHNALAPFWRETRLDAADETTIIKEFGTLLTTSDHRQRMESMYYKERVNSGARFAQLSGAPKLAAAWGAVIRRDRKAGALLEAVPKSEQSAGYLFAKAHYLRGLRKYREAASVMAKAPKDQAALIEPDQWWDERRILSRNLLDKGDVKLAYEVAAGHFAESPQKAIEAEFHAGWYALRGLNDAATATKHFERILALAEGPISKARAHYWLGRANKDRDKAIEHYRSAARFGTTFYGQLAAAKLGLPTVHVEPPAISEADRKRFSEREAITAIRRLEDAGHGWRAHALYLALANELTSVGEIALLAAAAEQGGNHHMALKIGKNAAARGLDVGALSHPVGAIPAGAQISGAGKALAYAIARQESEFNPGAVSPAGALGLLQVMPNTAKSIASRHGLGYSQERLTSDAAYNATLGSQVLAEELERFDGSYILTFAAYNAGPRRAQEWMARYGDPRGKPLDEVVDWIERIPFSETRAYVQRVMENYQVYKMRLTGTVDIESDLRNGR